MNLECGFPRLRKHPAERSEILVIGRDVVHTVGGFAVCSQELLLRGLESSDLEFHCSVCSSAFIGNFVA